MKKSKALQASPLVLEMRRQAAKMQQFTMTHEDCLAVARAYRRSAEHWRKVGREDVATEAAEIATGFEIASRQRRAHV